MKTKTMKVSLVFSTCIVLLLGLLIMQCQYQNVTNQNVRNDQIHFTTMKATKNTYMMFIKDLRNAVLRFGPTEINGVSVLPTVVPRSQRFVEVQLSNWAENTITIAIDITNLYVVAYRTGTRSFFLRDIPPEATDLFPGTTQQTLSFDGSYGELERAAGSNRGEIHLGIEPMENAISNLFVSSGTSDRDIARALIVFIQMISEAARFRTIEQMVRASINTDGTYTGFTPNPYMLSLENSWGNLATEVQSANSQTLSFEHTVVLRDENNINFDVTTVRQILFSLAIMKFICQKRNTQLQELVPLDHVHTRSMVEVIRDEICPNTPEPTVQIRGRNGYCVDVAYETYDDGNPIIIWKCENKPVNQLWTFKTDGTIRSNGKCLTTYGYATGSYIMIFDCVKAVVDATKWELWSNGTIINPRSGLALSAPTGNSGTTLTVATNTYASSQGWSVSLSITNLPKRYIVGFNDLCLYTDGSASVWLIGCGLADTTIWALYPDNTIRPWYNQGLCLVRGESDNLVRSSSCTGSNNERWVFENDGTIKNLNSGLGMDVKESNPSLKEILAYPFTGNPNQIWYLRTA